MDQYIVDRIANYCRLYSNLSNGDMYIPYIDLIKRHIPTRILNANELHNFTGSEQATKLITLKSKDNVLSTKSLIVLI